MGAMTSPTEPPTPVSLTEAWTSTTFLRDRSPTTDDTGYFAVVTPYRDGAVFLANYAGWSNWERHPVGEEIVTVVSGSTTMTLLIDGQEVTHDLGAGDMIVVPTGVWHRFDSPDGVRVMTVTPQPTEHHDGDGLPGHDR
jgi:mannose-6-phosphate isomerase-like protein (cupin superfamily)